MNIVISNSSGQPIYEQIARQIKGLILRGQLKEGEALPSMRLLAKDLQISVITTKRAYEELEREGFLHTMAGKGCYVSGRQGISLDQQQQRQVEEFLRRAVEEAQNCGMELEQLTRLLEQLYLESSQGKDKK